MLVNGSSSVHSPQLVSLAGEQTFDWSCPTRPLVSEFVPPDRTTAKMTAEDYCRMVSQRRIVRTSSTAPPDARGTTQGPQYGACVLHGWAPVRCATEQVVRVLNDARHAR